MGLGMARKRDVDTRKKVNTGVKTGGFVEMKKKAAAYALDAISRASGP